MPLLKTSDGNEPLVWIQKNPLVSLAVTSWNTAGFIESTLQSIYTQTYPNWEIIFIDDCSSDKTIEKIKGFVKRYSIQDKCRLFKTAKNSGYGTTLKAAIEYGSGELVTIVDSDDLLADKDALKESVQKHIERPDVSMTYSDYYEGTGARGSKFLIKTRAMREKETYLGKFNAMGTYLGNGIDISHLKTFKRGFYNMTIGLDYRLLKAVDKDLILKLEEVGNLLYIPKGLYTHCKQPNSISSTFRDKTPELRRVIMAMKDDMYKEARRRRHEGLLTRIGETYCYSENGTLLGKNGVLLTDKPEGV